MEKVLIITYYWPPSGGAGVQRWVKLAKFLTKQNITVHILTVDEKYASYMQYDSSFDSEIKSNNKLHVHKTKSFEIISYYSKIAGKKNVPTAGFSNVDNASFTQKVATFIRSNFFIPDPRKGWNKYAYKEAVKIINKYNIKTVITSSPPHSTQLIGLKLKKKLNINWVADLRDPWTDIYYYSILKHTFVSSAIDKAFERKVLVNADKVLTVSEGLKDLFLAKSEKINPDKIKILPNGFDPDDFINAKKTNRESFTICYTGTMSDQYEPQKFLETFSEFIRDKNDTKILLQIVGNISKSILENIEKLKLGNYFQYIDTVPHNAIIDYQINASVLLLIIPNVKNAKGILTGKLFEYLASKNPILMIGPKSGDAAKIISECNAGIIFERNEKESIKAYLEEKYQMFKGGESILNSSIINEYNRKYQAQELMKILNL